MANDTLYAWSPIKVGEPTKNAENPGDTNVIKPGATVTQADTGLNDVQWEQLVESGAVKPLPYPDMPNTFQGSPIQYLLEQAKKAADDTLLAAQTSEQNISAVRVANAAATGAPLPEGVEVATAPPEGQQTQVQRRDDGSWIASDDGGQSWRKATDAEIAANT